MLDFAQWGWRREQRDTEIDQSYNHIPVSIVLQEQYHPGLGIGQFSDHRFNCTVSSIGVILPRGHERENCSPNSIATKTKKLDFA